LLHYQRSYLVCHQLTYLLDHLWQISCLNNWMSDFLQNVHHFMTYFRFGHQKGIGIGYRLWFCRAFGKIESPHYNKHQCCYHMLCASSRDGWESCSSFDLTGLIFRDDFSPSMVQAPLFLSKHGQITKKTDENGHGLTSSKQWLFIARWNYIIEITWANALSYTCLSDF
jgi:hypothetical protein